MHHPHPKSELATSFFILLAWGTPLLTPGTICPTAACQDLMLVDFGFALLDLLAFRFAFPTLPLLLGDTHGKLLLRLSLALASGVTLPLIYVAVKMWVDSTQGILYRPIKLPMIANAPRWLTTAAESVAMCSTC
jgi:hypothetical protein